MHGEPCGGARVNHEPEGFVDVGVESSILSLTAGPMVALNAMVPAQKLPPIVIIGPSRDVDFLRAELIRAGVKHPLMCYSSTDDARDFLDAALVAMSLDDRFVPCLTLLDAAVSDSEQARFVEWTRRQAGLQGMHVTLIETDEAGPGSPLIHERVQLKAGAKKWREVVSKSCQ